MKDYINLVKKVMLSFTDQLIPDRLDLLLKIELFSWEERAAV